MHIPIVRPTRHGTELHSVFRFVLTSRLMPPFCRTTFRARLNFATCARRNERTLGRLLSERLELTDRLRGETFQIFVGFVEQFNHGL